MAAVRLPMRQLREIIRLKLKVGKSGRKIAKCVGVSPATVSEYLGRVKVAKLTWPLPPELDDDGSLNRLLFPEEGRHTGQRPEPDWSEVNGELRRKGVTKTLLWNEYREKHPDGYEFSRFCDLFQRWSAHLTVTMRQSHRAGEKCFVDFSGDGIDVVDRGTGECRKAKLFVAVLGASSLTYVEPVFGEDLPTWISCHIGAFEYFNGAVEILVPDNLKSGVSRADRYEAEVHRTYAEMARHYGAVVIPARVRKPRDKAKVEAAVLLAQRWIIAVLRHRTFYSLEEVRQAVKPLVEKLNDRPMQRLKKSRRQLFEQLEQASLKPLPATPYEFAEWSRPRVHIDYHVEHDDHFYSAPYQLVREQLDLRATATTIEIFRGGRRVCSHVRSFKKYGHTTLAEHMPRGHRELAEWTPPRLIAWAKKVGPMTAQLVEKIMRDRVHAEQGFRSCQGLLALRKTYSDERIERACARALARGACTSRSVKAILRNNLDREETAVEEKQACLPLHENVRGRDYYH